MKRLALVLVLFAAGCCSVDHDRQIALAEQQIKVLDKALALSDEELSDPDLVRSEILEPEKASWILSKTTHEEGE